MQRLELKSGINAYASYLVIIELLAHIASTSDPAHRRSLAALKRLWRHCSKPVDGRETLMFLADSQNQICKALFDMRIPWRETEPPAYAAIVGTIAHSDSPADWSRYQPQLDYLKDHVAKIEDRFVQDVWQHVVLGVDPNAGSWRPLDNDPILRKRLADAVKSPLGSRLSAVMIVLNAAAELKLQLDQATLEEKVDFVMAVFATPLALYNEITRRIIMDGCDLRKESRGNWIWDTQIAFQTSPLAVLGQSPIWLVTDDGAILDAARDAGAEGVVKSLTDYRAFLSSTYET